MGCVENHKGAFLPLEGLQNGFKFRLGLRVAQKEERNLGSWHILHRRRRWNCAKRGVKPRECVPGFRQSALLGPYDKFLSVRDGFHRDLLTARIPRISSPYTKYCMIPPDGGPATVPWDAKVRCSQVAAWPRCREKKSLEMDSEPAGGGDPKTRGAGTRVLNAEPKGAVPAPKR